MPDCMHYENLCSASVDGTLNRAEKKELEAHLKTCPACREYLEDMRVMRTLWRELDHPLPAGLHGSIMAAVQADLAQQKSAVEAEQKDETIAVPVEAPIPLPIKKRTRSMIVMLAAAAACVALVVSGGLAGLPGIGGTSDSAAAAVTADVATTAEPQESMNYAVAASENAAPGARVAGGTEVNGAPEAAMDAATSEMKLQTVPKLPDLVAERQFAATYLATGAGELPLIEEAVLLTAENGCGYYSLPNDISVLEKVIDTLPGAGYTVAVAESTTGVGTEDATSADGAATEVLLIVITEE